MKSNKYRRIAKLGKGSFGDVHLVENLSTKELFALKKMDNLRNDDISTILNEIALLQELNHPNIIRYREYFKEGYKICLLMEYADNGDLYKRVQEIKKNLLNFSESIILSWLAQLCLALHYLHKRHIIHRDIKLQNIFLSKEGLIKLGDFGVSKKLDKTDGMAFTTLGTPYYISPEICQGYPYNNKTDIWMLGCVFFELCNLERPFSGCSLHSLVKKIVEVKQAKISNRYSPFLQNLIESMLEKDPDKRPKISDILDKEEIKKEIRTLRKKYPNLYNDPNPLFLQSDRSHDLKSISFHDYLQKRTNSIHLETQPDSPKFYDPTEKRKFSMRTPDENTFNIEKSKYDFIYENNRKDDAFNFYPQNNENFHNNEEHNLSFFKENNLKNNGSKLIINERCNHEPNQAFNKKQTIISEKLKIDQITRESEFNQKKIALTDRIREKILKKEEIRKNPNPFQMNKRQINLNEEIFEEEDLVFPIPSVSPRIDSKRLLFGKENKPNLANNNKLDNFGNFNDFKEKNINISFDEFSKEKNNDKNNFEQNLESRKNENHKKSISLHIDVNKFTDNFANFLNDNNNKTNRNEGKVNNEEKNNFAKNFSVFLDENQKNKNNRSFLEYINEKIFSSNFEGDITVKKRGLNLLDRVKIEDSLILENDNGKKRELMAVITEMSKNGNSKSWRKLFFLLGNLVENNN